MKLTTTYTRHRGALVFALSWCWHPKSRYQTLPCRAHTVTVSLGLWAWHFAWRQQ